MSEEKKEIKKQEKAQIDRDVLETMSKKSIDEIVNDPVKMKRAILNAVAEFLSELKHLNQSHEEFTQLITILSSDKIQEFFYETKKNFDKEQKRVEKENNKLKDVKPKKENKEEK